MRRVFTVMVVLATQTVFISPLSADAKMSCAQVTTATKKLFEGEYKGDPDKALVYLAKNLVKAYTLTLENSGCFSKKEITDMRKQISTMKSDCNKAKKDELTWMIQKELCAVYPALYKYIK